jgi:hypothetical protein
MRMVLAEHQSEAGESFLIDLAGPLVLTERS